ncbi:MAG: tRNA (guanine(10)-N(2))-dimethyltransferase [Promethearchaeota archaeon]
MVEKKGLKQDNLIIKKEGLAQFYVYKIDEGQIPSKSMKVFYNQKMAINRDVSSLAIRTYYEMFDEDLVIVDSMAASGIGAIRILLECENVKEIYINDINPVAVELIRKNLVLNKIDEKSHIKIRISRKDANYLFSKITQESLISNESDFSRPNVVSIDPFGTPNIYVNSAFNAIQKSNGLMCVTATDTAVLFGIRSQACIRKYMAKPLHVEYSKEIGARILIYFLSRMANVNKMGVIPLLTFYSNHFIRVFLLTFKDQGKITQNFDNYGYLIHCKECNNRWISSDVLNLEKKCSSCSELSKVDHAGPLWIGKIHDEAFLRAILRTNDKSPFQNKKRLSKILMCALDELEMPISYYNIHGLCQTLNLSSVPKMEDVIALIEKNGFHASRTHFDFTSIKTDMKLDELKKMMINQW